MNILIAGSRNYPKEHEVREYVQGIAKGNVILAGGARGVDRWAEDEARKQGLEVKVYPAQWERYGRGAGYRRNAEMVRDADKLVAFWNGSKGTAHTIRLAVEKGIAILLVSSGVSNEQISAVFSSQTPLPSATAPPLPAPPSPLPSPPPGPEVPPSLQCTDAEPGSKILF